MLKRREDGKDYRSPNCTRNYKDITELMSKVEKTEINIKVINDNINIVLTFAEVTTPNSDRQATTSKFTSNRPALTNIDQTANNRFRETWL